jgi:hypothetical protein
MVIVDVPAPSTRAPIMFRKSAKAVTSGSIAALSIADRGYVLETGAVTLTGTGEALIHNEQVRAAYLGI